MSTRDAARAEQHVNDALKAYELLGPAAASDATHDLIATAAIRSRAALKVALLNVAPSLIDP